MSKLQKTEAVTRVDFYSNSGDESRSYDVKAKVTINADGTSSISEGFIRIKGGDATIGTFEKTSAESATYSPTGSVMEQLRIVFPGNPATVAVKAAVNDVCAFIDEVSEMATE